MNFFDAAKLALANIKDRLNEDTYNELKRSYMETLEAEAEARRLKMACDVLRMNTLRISVKKLEYTYSQVKNITGQIAALDELIRSAKCEIKMISLKKNSCRS